MTVDTVGAQRAALTNWFQCASPGKRTKTVPGLDLATSHHLPQGRRGERAARQEVHPVRRGVTPPHRTAHSAGAAAYWSVPTARGQPSASLRAQSRQAAATGRSVKLRTRSAEETGKGGILPSK